MKKKNKSNNYKYLEQIDKHSLIGKKYLTYLDTNSFKYEKKKNLNKEIKYL